MQKLKAMLSLLLIIYLQSVSAQTTYIRGLTVIVEFADAPFTNSIDSVQMMMDQPGFSGWGNDGSVRDYYLLQSNGKFDLTNTVIKITLPYAASVYYDDKTRRDMPDIVEQINLHYPNGFQNLTTNPDGSIKHFTLLTKCGRGGWAFGDQNVDPIKNNGVNARVVDGSFTHYGLNSNPEINTICHETGHALFGWGDYYDIFSSIGQIGHYCVMGSGGNSARPMPVCAPLRYTKGWITTVTDITNAPTQTFSITTNDYTQVYKYSNPNNSKEYFLISAHKHGGSYIAFDGEGFPLDQGLAVWYVDEDRGAGARSPYIKLIQADGLDEMTNPIFNTNELKVNLRGDLTDLFDNEFPTLNDATHSTLRWKNGSLTGLSLSNISAVNTVMTFQFNNGTSGCSGINTYCAYPCIYNQGDLVVYNGKKYRSLVNGLYNVTPGTASHWWEDLGTCGSSNAAPVVSLTSPTVLNYRAPATISIAANASDDVSVARVEFYNGTTLLGTDYSAPYEYSWTGVAVGFYTITAKAFDGDGLSSTSSPVSVTVSSNTAPVITITAPLTENNIVPKYLVGGSKTITVNATDDVSVWKVVFTLGQTGATVIDSVAPYSATFNNLPAPYNDGLLNFSVVAYDREGLSTGELVFVAKNKVPGLTITSPSSGATLTDNAVAISVLVNDTDWTSGKVEYFNGATKLGEVLTNTVGSTPITYTWTGVANGTYTITAKATDDMGEFTTSTALTFTVNKTTSTCTAPEYNANTAYNVGNQVVYNGVKYTANWWTQGQRPDLNNGGNGTGQPWTSNGICNAKMAFSDASFVTSIYPNPSKGSFVIESENSGSAQIINAFGKEVSSISLREGTNEVNLSLTSGIYYVKILDKVTRLVIE